MNLLIADDEKELTYAIQQYFTLQNYVSDLAWNGKDALAMVEKGTYDAMILDIMMPEIDGLQVLKEMRARNIDTPVLLLSAKSGLDDRVNGLNEGADDYLAKPFAMKELMARVKAMTRRKTVLIGNLLSFGPLVLNQDLAQLEYDKKSEHLSVREFQIMEMLMRSPESLVSGEQFLKKIWGQDSEEDLNIVCVYITYLRRKLTRINAPVKIQAVRGIGYQLKMTGE